MHIWGHLEYLISLRIKKGWIFPWSLKDGSDRKKKHLRFIICMCVYIGIFWYRLRVWFFFCKRFITIFFIIKYISVSSVCSTTMERLEIDDGMDGIFCECILICICHVWSKLQWNEKKKWHVTFFFAKLLISNRFFYCLCRWPRRRYR